MTSFNIKFKNYEELDLFLKNNEINTNKPLLIQIFSGVLQKNKIQELSNFLLNRVPKAYIIGATTDGEIINEQVTTNKIVISFTIFEKSSLKLSYIEVDSKEKSYEDGQILAQKLLCENTKVFISFASGLNINSEEFLNGLKNRAPNVVVAGGLAGDNGTFTQTYTIANSKIFDSAAVGISINSDELYINNKYSLAWENLGKTFTVNRSYQNILYEIDNMTPYELYKKYLGEEVAKELPGIGIEFPLIIQKNNEKIARAPLHLEDDGSMVFAGNINEGSKVKFGLGNIEELINGSSKLVNNLNTHQNEVIFIYSCMARRRFLDKQANLDIKEFSSLAPTSGFFTYGEFFSTDKCNELLNESLTILALSETKTTKKNSEIKVNKTPSKLLKQKAISHLIDTTSKELDFMYRELEEKIKEKTKENIEQRNYIFEKEKMAQMGEMIENIAHQWRQPLSSISSNVSSIIIQRKLNIINEDDLIKNLSKLLSHTKFLSETIDTFRNYMHEENATKNIVFQERLDIIIDIISSTLKDHHIKLINNINYNKPIIKHLTIGDLSQVVLNLLNNAKDILIENKINNPWIKIDCKIEKGQIITTVEDNGGGIQDDIRTKIFDPYFTTKHKSQGTGIGLYMSHNIATKKLGGDLFVKNSKHGAKFYLIIPLN